MIAKTDLVPVKPEGDGWKLSASYFISGSVCKCGELFEANKWGPPSLCPNCGADYETCALPCAYLHNYWLRETKTVKVSGYLWWKKEDVTVRTESAFTNGPWKMIKKCNKYERIKAGRELSKNDNNAE